MAKINPGMTINQHANAYAKAIENASTSATGTQGHSSEIDTFAKLLGKYFQKPSGVDQAAFNKGLSQFASEADKDDDGVLTVNEIRVALAGLDKNEDDKLERTELSAYTIKHAAERYDNDNGIKGDDFVVDDGDAGIKDDEDGGAEEVLDVKTTKRGDNSRKPALTGPPPGVVNEEERPATLLY